MSISGIWPIVVSGADPTGATDSTSAINEAITAAAAVGGTVIIPPGVYLVGTAGTYIVISSDNVNLIGAGSALTASQTIGTILKTTSNNAIVTWSNSGGCSMRGITVLGDNSSNKSSQHGIQVSSPNMEISNCCAINCSGAGIYVNAAGNRFYSCEVSNAYNNAIVLASGSDYSQFFGCYVTGGSSTALDIATPYNVFHALKLVPGGSNAGVNLSSSNAKYNKFYGLYSAGTNADSWSTGSYNWIDYAYTKNAPSASNGNVFTGVIGVSGSAPAYGGSIIPKRAHGILTPSSGASSVTIDFANGSLIEQTIASNTVTNISGFSNTVDGEIVTLILITNSMSTVSGTGWGTGFKWDGGTAPATQAVSTRNVFQFYVNGSTYYEISRRINVS